MLSQPFAQGPEVSSVVCYPERPVTEEDLAYQQRRQQTQATKQGADGEDSGAEEEAGEEPVIRLAFRMDDQEGAQSGGGGQAEAEHPQQEGQQQQEHNGAEL